MGILPPPIRRYGVVMIALLYRVPTHPHRRRHPRKPRSKSPRAVYFAVVNSAGQLNVTLGQIMCSSDYYTSASLRHFFNLLSKPSAYTSKVLQSGTVGWSSEQ